MQSLTRLEVDERDVAQLLQVKSGEGHHRPVLRAAVLLALYGASGVSQADDQNADQIQEVVVTATRREQSIQTVPYSISAVSGESLKATGVTDLVNFARAIPSFSIVDLGTRYQSSEIPVIRGINASNILQGTQQLAQSPVGVYLGNSPINGYFELTDVQRVEVLRGPQGTLYGAGALGGAVRVIPNSPELNSLSGSIEAGVGAVGHAHDPSYSFEGFANLPLGQTIALRVSGKYVYDPGFIDVFGITKRNGGPFSAPVLADPSAPATSAASFGGKRDWNYSRTFTGRASILWKLDSFSAELAYTNSHAEGDGGPQANPYFPGGPYPIDPRINFPAGGDYRAFSAVDQPYKRTTALTSLDMSYDVGFATLSSTSSYYSTGGTTFDDDTYPVFNFTPFETYYTGNPVNPRFIAPERISDSDKSFSQELRLVSHPSDTIDYVVGAFYQKQDRHSGLDFAAPGTDTYTAAQGCTAPFANGGALPTCLVLLGPNSSFFSESAVQSYKDRSLFGELTLHLTHSARVTFGARHYWQHFVGTQSELSYPFQNFNVGSPTESAGSGTLYKVNPSLEWAKDQIVYATWSQGFRRGGSNSFTTEGPLAESAQLLTYKPDKTNNYEVGVKGRFDSGFSYGLSAFDVEWDNPQIVGFTPVTFTPLVYNASKARSTGFEAETAGPLVLPALRYNLSVSHTDAHLTRDFSLPANNGLGGISPSEITGIAGQRLPGSPKWSAAFGLNYRHDLGTQRSISLTAGGTYTGSILNNLSTSGNQQQELPSYVIGNVSATLTYPRYRFTVYVNNIADKRAVFSEMYKTDVPIVGPLATYQLINQPREIGIRVALTGLE